MTNTHTQILEQLSAPFPPSCITTKTISGRKESWVEQHYLMERLDKVLPMAWSWTIVSITTEPCFVGKKDGQRASCHGRLTMWIDDKPITREGVGDKEMFGFEDARKAACSVAFRHACKFFTTFLWKGEAPISAPTPTVAPTPAPQAQAPAPAPAQPQQQGEDWMARVPDEWDNLMGAICELTHLTRAEFEQALWLHGCKFEDAKEKGRWVTPNTKTYPAFRAFAIAKPKWALSAVKEAQACRSLLEDNKPFQADVPVWNGQGHTITPLVITPRGAEQSKLDAMLNDPEIPF